MTPKATATFYENENGGEVVIRLDPRNAEILRLCIAGSESTLDESLITSSEFFEELGNAIPHKHRGMYALYDNESEEEYVNYRITEGDDYVAPNEETEEAEE